MTDRTSPEIGPAGAHDLILIWRGWANALRLMDSKKSEPDPASQAQADAYEQCAVELREALAAKPGYAPTPGLWRPIETAPKDRTIMLCVEGWEPCSGRWWPVDSCWASFNWEGHFETDKEMTSYVNATSYEPTHWMPLPQGPNSSTDRTNCGDPSCKDPNCAYGAGKSRCQRCGILCDHIYCVGCSDGADDLEHLDGMLDDRERE